MSKQTHDPYSDIPFVRINEKQTGFRVGHFTDGVNCYAISENQAKEFIALRAKLEYAVEALEAIYINGPKHEFDADTAQEALDKIKEK